MMRFEVSRSSTRRDPQPCEGAYEAVFIYTECHQMQPQVSESWYQAWYSEGANHRTEGDIIKRDVERTAWFVDITDLDALIAFQDKYGSLIIERYESTNDVISLEIYDGYRE